MTGNFTKRRCVMEILLANCCSLFPKFNELTIFLPATQPFFIYLTETWFIPSVSEPKVTLDSYTLFRSDRAVPRRGGGVALYANFSTAHSSCDRCDKSKRWKGCQFSLASRHITGLLVNRSPSLTEGDIILRVLRTVARLHGLILGYFDAPHGSWLTRSSSISNSFPNKLSTSDWRSGV